MITGVKATEAAVILRPPLHLIRPINWNENKKKEEKKCRDGGARTRFLKCGRPSKENAAYFKNEITWKDVFDICKRCFN